MKENLFKLVSKGDVILWVGAGSSLYAGLPSGNQLSESLFEGLSSEEKQFIDKNLFLPDLAEQIYRIKGNNRNYIIQKLKEKILLNDFSSISAHDNIAKIPHFRDIVTTNYDQLFEIAFKSKINLIYSDQQIPYLDSKKINLYKIHGDLSVPDSVIITKSDYDDFFGNRREEDILWTVIKEKIATKNILFVGYNLEDSNVATIFDNITKKLGANRKECFFVSPDIPPHKLYHLTSKNIHYINSKGEDLFLELIEYLKNNIKQDFEKQLISAEIYTEFIKNFNLKSEIEINEKKNVVKNFSGINKEPEAMAEFVIKSDYIDFDKVRDFSEGNYLEELTIDKSAFNSLDLRIEGIKIGDANDITNLTIAPIPIFDKIIDVSFEDGFEINDVHTTVVRGTNRTKVIIKFYQNEFVLLFDFKDNNSINLKVDYGNFKNVHSVTKQLHFYKAMDSLTSCKMLDAFYDGKLIFTTKEKFDIRIVEGLKGLYKLNLFYLRYFEKLKEIEKLFKIKFSNIDINDVNDKNYNYLNIIISKYNKQPIEQVFTEMSIPLPFTEKNKKVFNGSEAETFPIRMVCYMENINIHNHEFEMGKYDLHVVEPRIFETDNFLNGLSDEVRIESVKEKAIMIFQ
ncbi:SIR2 family NAD-dependent protein deacylase [Chryseobacterium indologenes]|uniref:SIR2 family NAD-dependent protein deacylase n=1 Tax=Chryseobacterium indologenes TaxID=253 RepID=UPI0016242104|nr:SIR2 family protein [Chryseobacterium indologenes]